MAMMNDDYDQEPRKRVIKKSPMPYDPSTVYEKPHISTDTQTYIDRLLRNEGTERRRAEESMAAEYIAKLRMTDEIEVTPIQTGRLRLDTIKRAIPDVVMIEDRERDVAHFVRTDDGLEALKRLRERFQRGLKLSQHLVDNKRIVIEQIEALVESRKSLEEKIEHLQNMIDFSLDEYQELIVHRSSVPPVVAELVNARVAELGLSMRGWREEIDALRKTVDMKEGTECST